MKNDTQKTSLFSLSLSFSRLPNRALAKGPPFLRSHRDDRAGEAPRRGVRVRRGQRRRRRRRRSKGARGAKVVARSSSSGAVALKLARLPPRRSRKCPLPAFPLPAPGPPARGGKVDRDLQRGDGQQLRLERAAGVLRRDEGLARRGGRGGGGSSGGSRGRSPSEGDAAAAASRARRRQRRRSPHGEQEPPGRGSQRDRGGRGRVLLHWRRRFRRRRRWG